jgi:hypothetical protein
VVVAPHRQVVVPPVLHRQDLALPDEQAENSAGHESGFNPIAPDLVCRKFGPIDWHEPLPRSPGPLLDNPDGITRTG